MFYKDALRALETGEIKIKVNQVWYRNDTRGQTRRIIRILAKHPEKRLQYGKEYTLWIYEELGGAAKVPKGKIWKKDELLIVMQMELYGTYKKFKENVPVRD